MSRDDNKKAANNRLGPQGTQMYSAEEIGALLEAERADHDTAAGARLTGMSAPVADRVFPLRDEQLLIGRSARCDIHIDEPSLSSEHARISKSGKTWRIINLLSTNGIFINDKKVFAHDLRDGDVIRLGRVQFRFEDASATASTRFKGRVFIITMMLVTLALLIGLALLVR